MVFFAGGTSGPATSNRIDYVTIASTGNAIYFGDLSQARSYGAGCSSPVRGVFGGGYLVPTSTRVNTIDYVTIASLGNAISFGALTVAGSSITGLSNGHGGL